MVLDQIAMVRPANEEPCRCFSHLLPVLDGIEPLWWR